MKPVNKVLIVSDRVVPGFGGSNALAWQYFSRLRARGVDAWLATHDSCRDALCAIAPEWADRMVFVADTRANRLCRRVRNAVPPGRGAALFDAVDRIATELALRDLARRLTVEHGIELIHQPTPLEPAAPTAIAKAGAPVVIGPMNGNLHCPPWFARGSARAGDRLVRLAHPALAWRLRGKGEARLLIAANARSVAELPVQGGELPAMAASTGIDTELWRPRRHDPAATGPARFVFTGPLVEHKALDLMLQAFAKVALAEPPSLDLIGDGPERPHLEALVQSLGLGGRVRFLGQIPQAECAEALRTCDAMICPGLRERTGTAALEGMATALPVIAAEWGASAEQLPPDCGILVPATSREALVAGLAEAMTRLGANGVLRTRMGMAGREHALRHHDWDDAISRILTLYALALHGAPPVAEAVAGDPAERLRRHQFIMRSRDGGDE